MNLSKLRRFQTAIILENNIIDPKYRKRLMELGIVPEAFVEVVSKSKLKGPLVIKVNEMHLAIEYKDAEKISVGVIE